MERLTDKTCGDFAAILASKEPVPGGGGAAALVGALAAALCSMVGNYTTGKKRYAAVEQDIVRLLDAAEAERKALVDLVEQDAEAFEPLSRAYGIPKEDPSRDQVLEAATKGACVAPLAMMDHIAAVIDLLEEMGDKGSRLLLSDVACGAYLARAALQAASVNVFVNTKTLADRAYADKAEAHCDELLATYGPRAERLAAGLVAHIRGRA